MNFLKTIVLPALDLLGTRYRRRGLLLLPLLLLLSLLDVLSIASFAPMALLIVRPESVKANSFLLGLYDTFHFQTERDFALAWVAAIAIFFLIKHFFGMVVTRMKARYAFGVSAFLSDEMLSHFINLPYPAYHELQSSLEQVKIAHLPITFAYNILLALMTLFTEGLILLLMLISLVIYDWHAVFFLLVILIPAITFYRIIKKKLNSINHSLKSNYPGLIHLVLQFFENFIEINLYQRKEYFIKKIRHLNQELHNTQILQTILQANSFRLFETVAAIGFCLLILYTIVADTPHDTTVMLLGLYTAAGFRALPSLNRIFVSFLQTKSSEHVLTGLKNVQVPAPEDIPQLPVTFHTNLELINISFCFPGKPLMLRHLSLSVTKGQRVALTGPSGSGKTTLLLMLMRFLGETEGEICVDGILLGPEHKAAWRKHLSYVPQHPVILDNSLLENIAFGVDPATADTHAIKELLNILDLGTWFEQLPDGLTTRFGERGIKLSGGQKQRIAIARALYSNAEVLLFDEAIGQLDAVTEEEVHKALKTPAHQHKTLIMVTHRQSSLHYFDKVFQLIDGTLKEVRV